jgi:hypothetical protein
MEVPACKRSLHVVAMREHIVVAVAAVVELNFHEAVRFPANVECRLLEKRVGNTAKLFL